MTISYDSARSLKDAGFPFRKVGGFLDEGISAKYGVNFHTFEKGLDEIFIEPTLSELIEACGENIILWKCEERYGGHWHTGSGDRQMRECSIVDATFFGSVSGSTPEEAVAKLWLELNKK